MSAPVIRHPGDLRWETRLLAVITTTLVVLGITSSYAASSLLANSGRFGGNLAFKQFVAAIVGGVALLVASRIDYHVWRRLAWPLLFGTVGLLLLPLLPFTYDIAPVINGARRWIRLGPVTLQPSEVARVTLVVWCAMLAAKKGAQVRDFKKGVVPFLLIIGLVSGLILLEPNLSMAALVGVLGLIVVFAAGARIGHLILLAIALTPILANQLQVDYRLQRILAFRGGGGPEGTQLHQSLVGFGAGGIFGVGFGEGQQKLGFLPYAYVDFLFSVIGEEWGLLGVLVVVMLFATFCWMGLRIARTAPDPFGQFLAVGLTTAVGVAAILHMSVTLGLMPSTGVLLPFMSAGGSGLVVSMGATGILINVGRQRGRPAPVERPRTRDDD